MPVDARSPGRRLPVKVAVCEDQPMPIQRAPFESNVTTNLDHDNYRAVFAPNLVVQEVPAPTGPRGVATGGVRRGRTEPVDTGGFPLFSAPTGRRKTTGGQSRPVLSRPRRPSGADILRTTTRPRVALRFTRGYSPSPRRGERQSSAVMLATPMQHFSLGTSGSLCQTSSPLRTCTSDSRPSISSHDAELRATPSFARGVVVARAVAGGHVVRAWWH